jgi:Tfp pilus assembly protein PilV
MAPVDELGNAVKRVGIKLRDQSGQGLIEVIIAMIFLAVAVAAVLALMTAGAISLQRGSQKGTALTLADKQLETFRTLAYQYIRLDGTAIPPSGAYVTAHSTDATIPASTPSCTTPPGTSNCLVVGTSSGETPCGTGPACAVPRQSVTGPDHRTYEVDTYITYTTPSSVTTGVLTVTGRPVKNVLVTVRDPARTNDPVVARTGSIFDNSSLATG